MFLQKKLQIVRSSWMKWSATFAKGLFQKNFYCRYDRLTYLYIKWRNGLTVRMVDHQSRVQSSKPLGGSKFSSVYRLSYINQMSTMNIWGLSECHKVFFFLKKKMTRNKAYSEERIWRMNLRYLYIICLLINKLLRITLEN